MVEVSYNSVMSNYFIPTCEFRFWHPRVCVCIIYIYVHIHSVIQAPICLKRNISTSLGRESSNQNIISSFIDITTSVSFKELYLTGRHTSILLSIFHYLSSTLQMYNPVLCIPLCLLLIGSEQNTSWNYSSKSERFNSNE